MSWTTTTLTPDPPPVTCPLKKAWQGGHPEVLGARALREEVCCPQMDHAPVFALFAGGRTRPLGLRTRPLGPWVRCLAKEKGTLSNMRSLAVPQRTLRSRRWAELSTPEDEAESSFTSKDPHRGISRHTYPPCNPCNVFVCLQQCKQVCLIASGLPPGRILESSSRWPVVMMENKHAKAPPESIISRKLSRWSARDCVFFRANPWRPWRVKLFFWRGS